MNKNISEEQDGTYLRREVERRKGREEERTEEEEREKPTRVTDMFILFVRLELGGWIWALTLEQEIIENLKTHHPPKYIQRLYPK